MANSASVILDLGEGMRFSGISPAGSEITLDAPPDFGGANAGPTPMELMLMALGGCTGMDVISLLRTMRVGVTGYQVRVEGDRADQHPKVYTNIRVEHIVVGEDLDPDKIHRAVEKSATRYCPASAMLKKAARIEEFVRIIDDSNDYEVVEPLRMRKRC